MKPTIQYPTTSKTKCLNYKNLENKTISDIAKQLPINGHTKIFTDICGIYHPEQDKKKYGSYYAVSVFDFTETYIYVLTR